MSKTKQEQITDMMNVLSGLDYALHKLGRATSDANEDHVKTTIDGIRDTINQAIGSASFSLNKLTTPESE